MATRPSALVITLGRIPIGPARGMEHYRAMAVGRSAGVGSLMILRNGSTTSGGLNE
jgi:hypothetical protein